MLALAIVAVIAMSGVTSHAQPNPYRASEGWGQLPTGRTWGASSAVHPAGEGTIWVAERCGQNTCVGREDVPPILLFDSSGKLMKAFGEGRLVWPHGIHVDRDGNVWVTDARGEGEKGHQVFKFSPEGKVLVTLGKAGVAGQGPDTFNGPSAVLVAPNGDIFVADGHGADGNNRIVKFSPEGRFIKSWGRTGTGPGELRDPHALAMDSQGRLFVGDRANNRIQIFDQEGNFLDQWTQFGRPSGIFIAEDDTVYVTDSESNASRNPGWKRGIRIGSAKDGSVTAFIPDPEPDPDNSATSGAEGVAADTAGNVYAAQVNPPGLKKYIRQRSVQEFPPGHVDPLPILQSAAAAIGADNLKCIRFSGTGYAGKVGQGRVQSDDWPRGEPLSNYTRTIDYEARSSVEEFTRKPGMNPRSWKYGVGWLGGTPIQQKERQTFVVSGNYAWHMDGEGADPIPAPHMAELWQLDLWLNPPGFIKAARLPAADPKAVWRWELVESGRDGATTSAIEKVHVVSITLLGKYRVNATINSQNLIQRIETKVPHPVLGDMNYEHEFSQWRQVGGVKFPAGWHHHEGYDDERYKPTISGGHNAFGGSFEDIRPNLCGPALSVPDSVRQATIPPARVEAEKLAEGVWLLGGSSHNSVAVEFRDFVAVVEAPLDEEWSLAVIEEIVKLAPNKPIRFVVNTHDHYDHLGGLRTYLHIGATIITHNRNRYLYEQELLNYVPRTLRPDMVSLYEPTEIREGYILESVAENYWLSDGKRNLHISYVQPLTHVEGMLMAYLPAEKIVIEADLYDPPAPRDPHPATPSAANRSFYDHVQRLGLEVKIIAPIHGRAVRWTDFVKFVSGN